MKRVMRLLAWIVAGSLASVAAAADAPAGAAPAPLAHSANLSIDGTVASGILSLRVQPAANHEPLHVTDLAVRVDGRPLPVMARADGSWAAPLKDVPEHSPGKLEIIVAHDGALEALDGQLPASAAAAPAAGGGTLGSLIHKQMSWWILNVVIVLIGVVAVSRRMS
jgi:hypothetical protein